MPDPCTSLIFITITPPHRVPYQIKSRKESFVAERHQDLGNMVASIPNDVFQFSTYAALKAGFNQGQPRTADLTSHGSDGIGVYEDGSLMMLKSGQAYAIAKDGKASIIKK